MNLIMEVGNACRIPEKLSKSAVVYPEEVIKNGGTTRISANGMPEQHDRESQGNVVVSGS